MKNMEDQVWGREIKMETYKYEDVGRVREGKTN